ncbi:hypothetical protein Asppvi_009513 [Aspergillus pseudoviridinutans]|uniref:GPI anchored glycoprotein n=1 Tax=Aspergillus pseudoviridinutans TaxID=1517512 RepID=A0A9P3BFY2_9EURO|nr:uncharacterized protein Asppvi_009513 [Aspergillus pseudoviridinutans]GIJ90556.1 hypothetical protein Asppvi_009513 [Aspergillus pseudoviridinutans]
MHTQSILSLMLLAAITTAAIAEEVVTLFLPEFDSHSLVGKVIGTDGPLTTYVVNCNPKPNNQNFFEIGDCAASSSGFSIVHGPSTFRGVFEYPQYTMAEDCAISDSTSVSCVVTMAYGSSTSVEAMATIGPVEDMYQTLTITGTEIASISATAQASTTAGTATATGSSRVTTTTGASTSMGETGKDTAVISKSTNAAAAQMTGHSNWVVGGAAAMAIVAAI